MNKYRAESRRAQRREKQRRACGRKVGFKSEEQAQQKGQRVYRCQYCGLWHRSGAFASFVATIRSRSKQRTESRR